MEEELPICRLFDTPSGRVVFADGSMLDEGEVVSDEAARELLRLHERRAHLLRDRLELVLGRSVRRARLR